MALSEGSGEIGEWWGDGGSTAVPIYVENAGGDGEVAVEGPGMGSSMYMGADIV